MTENERMSISGLLDVLNTGISFSTCHIEYAIQSDLLEDLISCLEELEQYRAIGTIEEFKALKEKSEPKKVIRKPNHDWTHEVITCPTCNGYLSLNEHHCRCGQKIEME